MSPVAAFHTVLGTLALATGAAVLVRPKGGRWHRATGRVYVGAMVALCLASFALRDSTPFFQGLGPFHVAACVSLATVLAGGRAALRRREGWLGAHYMWMAWSYIGLVMATGGHVQAPLAAALAGGGMAPNLAIGLAIGLVWGLPPVLGRRWIARARPAWDARPAA